MEVNNIEYTKSTLYPKEFVYKLNNAYIEIKSLVYKELDLLYNKYKNLPSTLKTSTVQHSLINKKDFTLLSHKNIDELYDIIMYTSTIDKKDYDIISDALDMVNEDKFKDETFTNCKICQERQLDKLRNCPMLDEEYHDKGVFYLLNNKKVDVCPMYEINNSTLVADALEAYSMYKDKLLPIAGGLLDQTTYFYRIAPLAYNKLYRPSLEDMTN